MLGGEIDATSLPYSTAADYIENGQLKSLCTVLSEPPTLLPDQLSASDTIPELVMDTEYVVLAPKDTPAEIVEAMNAAILEGHLHRRSGSRLSMTIASRIPMC